MLLDLRSLCEVGEQIADGAAHVVRRLILPIRQRVRYTIHSWAGQLQPVSGDMLTAVASFRPARRHVTLISGPDGLSSLHSSIRQRPAGPSQSSPGAYEAEDLAIFEELEREDRNR